jgi:hypothetical protein
VIPRIVHSRWRRQEEFAFGRGKSARSLRIFVDGETVPDSPLLKVLLAFAHHPEVELIGTDGRFSQRLHVRAYDSQNAYTPWEIEFEGGRTLSSAVMGPDIQRIGREFAEAGQEERGERATVMVHGAGDHGADAFATADPLLLEKLPRNVVESGNPMTVDEAVALLGLFLRVREDFTLDLGDDYRYSFDRSAFYFALMRDLTPSGWRWFSACVAHSHHAQDDRLILTAQSALERIERSLRARDRLHEKLQLPPSGDVSNEAIFYFDVALLMLGGAFDGLANVAHVVHGFTGSERLISWGSKSWMKKLSAVNPGLAQIMARGQPHRDARELVAIVRNTIHHESLRAIMWQSGGIRRERIVVPLSIEAELEAVLARVGTAEHYGVRREADQLYIEPGVYIERILPPVFASINAVMDASPMETLPGVDPKKLLTGPPDDGDSMFSAANRQRIRLLSGVEGQQRSSSPAAS